MGMNPYNTFRHEIFCELFPKLYEISYSIDVVIRVPWKEIISKGSEVLRCSRTLISFELLKKYFHVPRRLIRDEN